MHLNIWIKEKNRKKNLFGRKHSALRVLHEMLLTTFNYFFLFIILCKFSGKRKCILCFYNRIFDELNNMLPDIGKFCKTTEVWVSWKQPLPCLVPRRLSFDENVHAKEGGKETTGETSHRLLSVPFPWSLAIHHQSLAFRTRLPCENRSAWGGGWPLPSKTPHQMTLTFID